MSVRSIRISLSSVRTLLALGAWIGVVQHAGAQTLVESSAEARFQLDLQVPQAGLMPFIPPGWTTNVSTRGPAKDANLRAIFIERLTINGPEGRPVGDGSNILVYLTVPVTNPEGDNVQLVIGGIAMRTAWGTMIRAIVEPGERPSAAAASTCPMGTASIAERKISAR